MEITTDMIKELRAKTNAGVLDCRKALLTTDGDFQKAVDWLTEKGMATAAKRADRVASNGMVEMYSHGGGRVGVMVEVNCETDFVARSEAFRQFAHEVALQIAAASPLYISENDIPADVIASESEKAKRIAMDEGKPEAVAARIVEGRLNKYKDETCLLRQVYIRDDNMTVEKLLHQTIVSTGENVVIRRFQRWELGEGLGE
ncbi:MAG: translation elongation factor Ts [Chloroflexi bacterium]|nr:MAG: translation elongation factor Ts [Chloroflexota bacterium]